MKIQMDPTGVREAGDDMTALETAASAIVARSLDASVDAATAHPGWAASGALRACQQEWSGHLSELVGEVGRTAQKLYTAASMTQQLDAEAARRLKQILNELNG